MTIAKFRAARQLWARVAEVVGEPGSGAATVHAVTSLPMMTQRDPWVNMLRTTLAAFGAGVGGADTVLVQPFDAAIPGGLPGQSRVSRAGWRATPSCCCWRSPTSAGCSTPPAARGSSRTSPRRSREQAWSHFQEIEARGGFVDARDYVVGRDRSGARQADRRHRPPPYRAHRRQRVSELCAARSEPSTAAADRRLGRVSAVRRRVRGAARPLGRLSGARRCPTASAVAAARPARRAQHPRRRSPTNLLASGGIEAVNPGPLDAATVAAAVEQLADRSTPR